MKKKKYSPVFFLGHSQNYDLKNAYTQRGSQIKESNAHKNGLYQYNRFMASKTKNV